MSFLPLTFFAMISTCTLSAGPIVQSGNLLEELFISDSPFSITIENQSIELHPEHTRVYNSVDTTCVRGRVNEEGTFIIAQGPEGYEGVVRFQNRVYTIGGSIHSQNINIQPFLHQHDTTECLGGIRPSTSSPANEQPKMSRSAVHEHPAGSIEPTRVLVVYNTDARDDVSDINAYIVAMIESANQAYINSDTDQVEIVLAGAHLIDEQFSDDFGTVLRQTTNRYDAVGDPIHALRDATDADVIAMLVDQPGYCGLAWLAPGNAQYAVSVSDTDCALGNLTFAHELGHNQGCAHDPDNANSSSAPYGYGHRWDSNSTRSVMAYTPGTRVPHFSNPDVLYDGFPTGIANERDNARVLDETRDAMAGMRTGDGSGIDENLNTIPDRLEIAIDQSTDLDRNGQLDSVQIATNPSLDCNNDGIIDEEQIFPRIRTLIGTTSSFGSGIEPEFFTQPLPAPASDILIEVGIVGDIGESNESVSLVFNDGLYSAQFYADSSTDCYAPGAIRSISVPTGQLAQVLEEGIELRVIPSTQVGAQVCSNPNITIWIEYRTHNFDLDANGDGVIDTCECLADLDGNGTLNFFDITLFIQALQDRDPRADFNSDGRFNFFDVSEFLSAFGAGC